MNKSLITGLTAMALVSSSVSAVVAFPIAAPGTECVEVIVSNSGPIVATYEGNSATYSNDLYLMLDASGNPGDDGNFTNDRFIFNNHDSPVGSTADLGPFAVGTELIFRLFVHNTGKNWYTGPAARNEDGRCHARVQGNWTQVDKTLVSFEDKNDFAYNDLSFSFTNTGPVITCPDQTALVDITYNSVVVVSGGTPPYTFAYEGDFPSGLELNPATGEVSGTPTVTGMFTFRVTATDVNAVVAAGDCEIDVHLVTSTHQVLWGHVKTLYR